MEGRTSTENKYDEESSEKRNVDDSNDEELGNHLLTMLSLESFSVAEYLNVALVRYMENEGILQQRMAELALQLQLQTQGCHEDIGRIGAELQAILPRCHADVGRIGVGLQGLQQDAATLAVYCNASSGGGGGGDRSNNNANQDPPPEQEKSMASSLETLSTLYALQANLRRTFEILTAAATWDSTLEEIPTLLATTTTTTNTTAASASSASAAAASSSNLPLAVQKLALLEKGEKALRGMPHPEERTAAIRKLRIQISNLLQPQLQQALANMSSRLAPLQQCVSLYSQLDMLPQLVNTYVASRPLALHKAWFDFRPQINNSNINITRVGAAASATLPQSSHLSAISPLDFIQWLPTWFDSVLQLLQEERRQASAVFGPHKVPKILALVLQEIFRPILPTFASRLQAAMANGGDGTENLNFICHVYKDTLQCLAVVYETIAACWLDWIETGGGVGGGDLATNHPTETGETTNINAAQDGVVMYRQIMDIFRQIVSPFSKYQATLIQLEEQAAQDDLKTFKEKGQQFVPPANTTELEHLNTATDGWLLMSRERILPLAQDILGRFEFLQGGCHAAAPTLHVMDQVTAVRIQYLTTCLNQTCSQQQATWATVFDEPHVLAALQVLKIAASCQSSIVALQLQSQQQLTVLAERFHTVIQREKEIQLASASSSNTKHSGVFLLPDSLSPVEISAILHFDSFASMGEAEAALTVLHRLSSSSTGSPVLLGQASSAVTQMTAACHKFVFTVCVSVPQRYLQSMAALASWKATGAEDMSSYGILPQAYITHVGEHMLALVQALEPFASDPESLGQAKTVMQNIRQAAEQPWRDFVKATGVAVPPDSATLTKLIRQLMESVKELKELVVIQGGGVYIEEDDDDEEARGATEGEEGTDKEVTAFCNAWLDVVGLAVTGRLLERILNIPQLTVKGCEHLMADLGYLQNMLVALGISGHPHVLIGHVAQLVSLDGSTLRERIRQAPKSTPLQATLVAMEERLAAMKSAG